MRETIRALAALGLVLPVLAAARADEAPRTVSDYEIVMNAAASRLDQQNSARQRAGDMAAAQRLALVATMVRRAAEEFRGSEQEKLNDPAAKLPAPIPALLKAAVSRAAEAELAAADHPAFVDEAQQTFNALIAALPHTAPAHPVLYGLLSNDLADPAAPLPSDIVFYGYRLVDPVLKIPPAVQINGSELPQADIVVHGDRFDVTLPDDVKKLVNFAPPPCDSRHSFGVRVRETYYLHRGVWPLTWNQTVVNNTDFYALPSPVIYSARIVASTESTSATSSTFDFDKRSDYASADCGETKAVEVTVALPERAQEVNCKADWVEASGAAKINGRCAIEGNSARANGSISGGPIVCSPEKSEKICTCTNIAHGFLEASGSYKLAGTQTKLKVDVAEPVATFPSGGMGETRIAIPAGQTLQHVALDISRRDCPQVVDTIDLEIGVVASATITNDSKSGVFRAVLKNGALTVGAVVAFPTVVDKTP